MTRDFSAKSALGVLGLIATLAVPSAYTNAEMHENDPQYRTVSKETIAALDLKDPFVLYAVDANGEFVVLVPEDIEVEQIDEQPLQSVQTIKGITIFRYEGSDKLGGCGWWWPPHGGDPNSCSAFRK